MKDYLSSADIAALVKEMQLLIGSFVDKIYQLDKETVMFRLNIMGGGKQKLVVRSGKLIFLTRREIDTPTQPTAFAMTLRKYLDNARVTKIEQFEFDRIVEITCQKEREYKVIIELFREGNIILVSEGKIIQPLKRRHWSHREIKMHEKYSYPPSKGSPLGMDQATFDEIIMDPKRDLVRTLALALGLGGDLAEKICSTLELDKNMDPKSLTGEEKNKLYKTVQEFVANMETHVCPAVRYVDDRPTELFSFGRRETNGSEIVNFTSVSEAAEALYFGGDIVEVLDDSSKNKIARQIEQQKEAIETFQTDIETYKKKAEIIYLYYAEIESKVKLMKDLGWQEGVEALKNKGLVSHNPKKKEIIIALDGQNLIIDTNVNLNENANRYYERSKKTKERLAGAEEALAKSEKRLKDLANRPPPDEKKTAGKTSRKKFWFERFRWFISSEGNIVVAGRDAKSNDTVVKKHLSDKDRYAHADIHGAPSVVIKRGEEDIGAKTLEEACIFALSHSKAWNSKLASGSAYWVLPEQVSKTPSSGEFLAKGAFIVRGKRNYFEKGELKLAVGIVNHEGVDMLMCGPVDAVKNRSSKYLVIVPGGMNKETFAKEAARAFSEDIDTISRITPPGGVQIIEEVGLNLDKK